MKQKIRLSNVTNVTSIISSTVTVIALLFAIFQLNNNNNTRNADFAHRFKNDFFSEKTTNLIMLLDNELIKFKVAKDSLKGVAFPYFEIDTFKLKSFPSSIKIYNEKIITAYDIDTYVLNHLDDIGEYYEKGIISLDYVNNRFGYYIASIHENAEIKKYREWMGAIIQYKNFCNFRYIDYIYNKIKNIDSKNRH